MSGRIITDMPPADGKGGFKHKFEIKMRNMGPDPEKDGVEKAVFVDGKKLDFAIDVIRFLEAKRMGPAALFEEQQRIQRQFIKSVSEAVGRRVTIDEIKRATVEGWI